MKYLSLIYTMKKVLITCILYLISTGSYAQSAADSIKLTIDQLFTAIKNADSNLLKNQFTADNILQTIVTDSTGAVSIRTDNLSDFASFVHKQQPGIADERITYESILIDGSLAYAWTPYKFYYKGQFSHCGVNAFTLVRIAGNWKIHYLIDTRHKTGCLTE